MTEDDTMNETTALSMIRDALVEVAADRKTDFDDINGEMSIEDLDLDSVATMEMVGIIEERLGTVFPDEELPQVHQLKHIQSLMLHGRVIA